jgi:hypothetical protein
MNPINAEGNMFSNLFDKVPAKRAGIPEDIVGTILYVVSNAGVCFLLHGLTVSHTSMDGRFVLMEAECSWQMVRNES